MKIDNIVVKNIDLDHSIEIIKTFVELGVKNKLGLVGCFSQNVYYGVIHGRFNIYQKCEINRPNIKIITLEQLKSMKDKSEYPKLMWVGDTLNEIEKDKLTKQRNHQRVVFSEQNGKFWSFAGSINMHNIADADIAYPWIYAQDIEETPDPKNELDGSTVSINGEDYLLTKKEKL